MSSALSGVKIAVLGGDDRELILAAELVTLGATVTVVGFPREKIKHGAFIGKSIEEALRGTEVVILPVPGIDNSGYIRAVYTTDKLQLTEKSLRLLADRALMIIGKARPFLREWTSKLGITLLEIAEMDEIAILNSVPTAEGAIQIAMEEMDITIHDSKVGVLGCGRVGLTLCRSLKALGAHVTVFSREPAELARAYELGCSSIKLNDMADNIAGFDVIFNTIPEVYLNQEVLKRMSPDTLIIDLASQPGGTDFEAANHYGIKAILAPGLPGKVAPRTAGKILAQVIPGLILEEMTNAGHKLMLA